MKKMMFLFVMAASSTSFATPLPEKIAPTPYVGAPAAVQDEARLVQPRQIDEGLRRANFELRIQNTKLVTEVAANKRTIEGQNQNLINLANQTGELHGELRSKEAALATEQAMRLVAEKENSELQQTLAEGGNRMFNEFFGVIIILAAISSVMLVLMIMAARNTAAVMRRIPNESSKEYADAIGAEFEKQAEVFATVTSDLRALARKEKARADGLQEKTLDMEKRNHANVEAMKKVLDDLGCDFRDLLKTEERKGALLQLKLDAAVAAADFREFEIIGQKKCMYFMRGEIEGLRKRLADAEETIAAMNGGKLTDPQAPEEPMVSSPADLVVAPGGDPARGTTAMAVVEDVEETGRLADKILETRGGLLPEGEAVTNGGSKPNT